MSGWRSLFPHTVHTPNDAIAFVAAVGFCTWLPLPGMDLPNLGEALGAPVGFDDTDQAGSEPAMLRRRVDSHAVMTQTWFWKDDLHIARRVYYGKIIRGQPTFIALDYLPDFVAAVAGRGQEIERDPARLYQEGRLSREAFVVYQHLLAHPALPTRELRRGLGRSTGDRSPGTDRALLDLQRRFLICKVDLTGRERGTYSYVWDLAERFLPDEFAEAQRTPVEAARERIRRRLGEFGSRTNPAIEEKLFWWRS